MNGETVYGYRDEEFYYLYPDLVYNKVLEFYRRQESAFPVSKMRLFSDLARLGLIQTQGERTTIKKRIGRENVRRLALKRAALDASE